MASVLLIDPQGNQARPRLVFSGWPVISDKQRAATLCELPSNDPVGRAFVLATTVMRKTNGLFYLKGLKPPLQEATFS